MTRTHKTTHSLDMCVPVSLISGSFSLRVNTHHLLSLVWWIFDSLHFYSSEPIFSQLWSIISSHPFISVRL